MQQPGIQYQPQQDSSIFELGKQSESTDLCQEPVSPLMTITTTIIVITSIIITPVRSDCGSICCFCVFLLRCGRSNTNPEHEAKMYSSVPSPLILYTISILDRSIVYYL